MMIDYTGQQIGSYQLVQRLGMGGFASVYLGQHTRIATQQAAIKLLHILDADSKKFQQEAETTAALVHPHIIRLFDFDFHDQMPFLVMDYASGGSLRSRHPKGTQVPLATVVQYVQEIAEALEYAHSKHVIHRDIKPDNVLISGQGELRLSDFGIAVLSRTGRTTLAGSYDTGGSPYYMAPEQSRGKPEKASDQYALGIMVYEWLCGKPPFSEGNAISIQYQHAYEPVPPLGEQLPKNTAVPSTIEQVILKALAKQPEDRFESVQAFAEALEKASVLPAEKFVIQLQPRKIALFGYETQGGSTSVLWTNPSSFSLDDETYLEWLETKRDFRDGEIVNSTWVKAGDHGYSFIVNFLPDGQLHESPLLDPSRQSPGWWKLINGVLRMNIDQHEDGTLVKYELDIFASQNGSVHSGIEFRDSMRAAHAYFVLLPSRQLNTKHYDEALAAFDHILCLNRHYAEVHKAKGKILHRLKRYEEALDAYQQAIELKPDYMWAFYEKGQILYDLKRYEEALALYERAIQINPNTGWFWHRKGNTLYELQRYKEALASYEQALRADPKFARPYNGMGNVLFRLECYEEAIAAYQRATELQPSYKWAWHNMGNVLHQLRRFEEALPAYKRTTEIDSDYAWAWYNMGDVLHELGRHEEALAAFDRAIKCDENVAVTWCEKGKTLQDLERYEEALASYGQALELESQYASIWTRKGQVLRMLKRYEEAIMAYDKALQLESDYVDAYLGKGRVYLDLGRYKDALDVYEQATNVAPNNTWTWHDKGIALGNLQHVEEALGAFEHAIELDPENKWAWFHKAETLTYLARQAYKKAGQPGREPLKREYYNLVQKATGKCLDGNGSVVYMHAPNGGRFQLWKATEVSPNTIILQHFQSGKVLEATVERGTYLNEYNNSPSQQWLPEDVDDGYKKLRQVATGMVLHGDTNNDVYLQPDNGGDFQIWRAVKIHITSLIARHDSLNSAEILVFEQ